MLEGAELLVIHCISLVVGRCGATQKLQSQTSLIMINWSLIIHRENSNDLLKFPFNVTK